MKKYVFVTFNICYMGGVQCYLEGKVKYLKETGWDVKVIYGDLNMYGKTLFPTLNKYMDSRVLGLSLPPYDMPSALYERTIRKCLRIIGDTSDCEEVIIESGNSIQALWGELLAAKIGAKHIFLTMNENYRSPGSQYAKMIDLFVFKYKRGEILGVKEMLTKLFVGTELEDYPFVDNVIIDEDPIADVDNPKVDSLSRKDWNICYLGRADKVYVDTIIKQVARFAKAHGSKSIHFIIIGDFTLKQDLLNKVFRPLENVTLSLLGEMVPVPRALYSKIDVMIAGSGSARHSAYEGKPIIVPDCYSCNSMGIYGYQTTQSLYEEDTTQQVSIFESLEDVLVKQIHLNMSFSVPPQQTPEICTIDNFKQIQKSDKKKEYFPIMEKVVCNNNLYNIAKLYMLDMLFSKFPKFTWRMKMLKKHLT